MLTNLRILRPAYRVSQARLTRENRTHRRRARQGAQCWRRIRRITSPCGDDPTSHYRHGSQGMEIAEFEILSGEGGTCLREPGTSMEVGYCEVEASADFKAMQMKCSNVSRRHERSGTPPLRKRSTYSTRLCWMVLARSRCYGSVSGESMIARVEKDVVSERKILVEVLGVRFHKAVART